MQKLKPFRIFSFAWAAGLLSLVAWLGPRALETLGLTGRWGPLAAGGLVLLVLFLVSRRDSRRRSADLASS